MPRFQLAVLFGWLLAGSCWAQNPADEFNAPKPAPAPTQERAAASPSTLDPGLTTPGDFAIDRSTNGWRYWVSADYAVAWLKARPLPGLATTSPPGTAQGAAGVLGMIGTTTLLGDVPITQEARSLGRLDFGSWFGSEQRFGAAAGLFVTESKGGTFVATSDGSTIIARPFTDATNGTPSSVLVAFPGVSSGSVNVSAAM